MANRIEVLRICSHCEQEFIAKTTTTKYCSHKCNKRDYKIRKRNEKIEVSNSQIKKRTKLSSELLKMKEFLTVQEVSQLLNCSIRSIYYSIENGHINAVNLGKRLTRVKRSEIDRLFKEKSVESINTVEHPIEYQIDDCYNMKTIQEKYGISEKGLYELIKRNNIPKFKKGRFSYVPKETIDEILK